MAKETKKKPTEKITAYAIVRHDGLSIARTLHIEDGIVVAQEDAPPDTRASALRRLMASMVRD